MPNTLSPAAIAMSKARIQLLATAPFFGQLSMKLLIRQARDKQECPTMATDGTYLIYDPDFTLSLTPSQVKAVIAHEVLHCALLHCFRMGDRKATYTSPDGSTISVWNIACDYAVNALLKDSRDSCGNPLYVDIPQCVYDAKYTNQTADYIYAELLRQAKSNGPSKDGSGISMGDVRAPGSLGPGKGKPQDGKADANPQDGPAGEHTSEMTQEDWKVAVAQAAKSSPGTCPASLRRLIAETCSTVDWREVLKNFVSNHFPTEQSWSRANRRTNWNVGIIIPGTLREGMGEIVFGCDTSGSISPAMLSTVWAEIKECVESCKPERAHAVWCDAQVHGSQSFSYENVPAPDTNGGGGGTRMQPVFDWIAGKGINPKVAIYLTDLESSDVPRDPGYPVLWITPEWQNRQGWFGETIKLKGVGR